jgi:hypothetical protein
MNQSTYNHGRHRHDGSGRCIPTGVTSRLADAMTAFTARYQQFCRDDYVPRRGTSVFPVYEVIAANRELMSRDPDPDPAVCPWCGTRDCTGNPCDYS